MVNLEARDGEPQSLPSETTAEAVDINSISVPLGVAKLVMAEDGDVAELIPTNTALKILGVSRTSFIRSERFGLVPTRIGTSDLYEVSGVLAVFAQREEERIRQEEEVVVAMGDLGNLITLKVTLTIMGVPQSTFYANGKFGLEGVSVPGGVAKYYDRSQVELVAARMGVNGREKVVRPAVRPTRLKPNRVHRISNDNPFLRGLDEAIAQHANGTHLVQEPLPSQRGMELGYYAGILLNDLFVELTEIQRAYLELRSQSGGGIEVAEIAEKLGLEFLDAERLDNEMIQRLRVVRIQAELSAFSSSTTESGTQGNK